MAKKSKDLSRIYLLSDDFAVLALCNTAWNRVFLHIMSDRKKILSIRLDLIKKERNYV